MTHQEQAAKNLRESIKSLNNAQIELEFLRAQKKDKIKQMEIEAMIQNLNILMANIEGLLSLLNLGNTDEK